ncbi:MAG: endonuclease III [Myxococcota bacterium]
MSGSSPDVSEVLRILSRELRRGRYADAPVLASTAERTPFQVLVGCLVSQRVRDEQTAKICAELFAAASTPERLAKLSRPRLERILRPAGFYRQKTKHLRALAKQVLELGEVPHTREGLLALPGIGPKCANIVLASCFGAPAIAVDTHVHRISNRLGWVGTRTPEQTEAALTPLVPVRWRRRVNRLLVAHGQLVCKPRQPRCAECAVRPLCRRRGLPAGVPTRG